MSSYDLPATSVARLPGYLHALRCLASQGVQITSSQQLSQVTGVEAPKIRRDLSYLGSFGTRGVGYRVGDLIDQVSRHLGLSRIWPIALVGCGKLGTAVAAHLTLLDSRFQIVAAFDPKIETPLSVLGDLEIMAPELISTVVAARQIEIAIIATPQEAAQEVADALVAGGVAAILNFAPVSLAVRHGVAVRQIDLVAEMQILAFHQATRAGPGVATPTPSLAHLGMSQWLKEQM